MRRPSVEELIAGGTRDPRTLPSAVPHRLDEVTPEEAQALEAGGLVANDYMTLRLPVVGIALQGNEQQSIMQVTAVLPPFFRALSRSVLVPQEQTARDFQAALGPLELRICVKKEGLALDFKEQDDGKE
jgi:hypothetical protein